MKPKLPDADRIPAELKAFAQFLCWRYVKRVDPRTGKGRVDKVPFGLDGGKTDPTDISGCGFLEAALAAARRFSFDGVGFVMTGADPFIGIDLDGCVIPATGIIEPWAQRWVEKFASYTEYSPSGRGLRIFIKAVKRGPRCRWHHPEARGEKKAVEVYDQEHYLTLTGNQVPATPSDIAERQAEFDELYRELFGAQNEEAPPDAGLSAPEGPEVPDDELLERIRSSRQGEKFDKLFSGDLSDWPKSRSDADYALASMLLFWTRRNYEQTLRLLWKSALAGVGEPDGAIRDKWNREDYLPRTIRRALERTVNVWCGPGPREVSVSGPDAAATSAQWPDPLAPEAFHGLAGEFVNMLAPHTEADTAAVLVQFLVGFGNAVGHGAFYRVEADRHYTNENALIVGVTGKGRKGVSQSQAFWPLATVDKEWREKRVASGLSSGEGLIFAVRDPIFKTEAVKDKVNKITGYQEVMVDPGEPDKRLMDIESEFAKVLSACARETSTTSAILRQAWDSGMLRVLTRNSPLRATNAHISVIAHVTRDEMLARVDDTALAGGLINRFLIVCARRSKLLPDGGQLWQVDFQPLISRLLEAAAFAKRAGRMRRDGRTREVWRAVYPDLSEGRLGLVGAATSRSEAHVVRLSMMYALLDSTNVIRPEHLMAALAVWQYCEDSARYVFGDSLGDPTPDAILRSLRQAPEGLSRTQISELFGKHKPAAGIARALNGLMERGLARFERRINTGGGPAETWFALRGAAADRVDYVTIAKQALADLPADLPEPEPEPEEPEPQPSEARPKPEQLEFRDDPPF